MVETCCLRPRASRPLLPNGRAEVRWSHGKRSSLRASFRAARGGEQDGLDDSAIATATADVAVHEADHFGFGGLRVLRQQRNSAHHYAGCAVGTLKSADVQQCLLQGMQPAAALDSLDRSNLLGADRAARRETGAN